MAEPLCPTTGWRASQDARGGDRPMLRRVKVKLYALPGSHPCAAVEVALRLKSIDYERVDLLPLDPTRGRAAALRRHHRARACASTASDWRARARSCAAWTSWCPSPPLLPPPSDAVARARVLEAERWGDEVLQSVPRRLLDAAFLRDPACMESYAGDAKLPLPRAMLRPALPLTAKLMARATRPTTRKRRPTCRRCRPSSTTSTPGSPMECSAASSRMRRTCRSAARSVYC